MKRPSFFHGVIVAAVLGFFASAIVATLTPFIGLSSVVRLVIPAMTLAYLLYLFSRSDERLGRVTALTFWAILAVVTWWLAPPLPLWSFQKNRKRILKRRSSLNLTRPMELFAFGKPSLCRVSRGKKTNCLMLFVRMHRSIQLM